MRSYPVSSIVLLRFLSALPFAVYYSSLQLYLIYTGFDKALSTSLVGSVLALSFGLSLVGGYLGNRYISYRSFFIISMFCQAVGCLTFSTTDHNAILWFSSLFLVGNTGLTVSLNMVLTQQYKAEDYSRENAFFWFYMVLNLGFLLGYSISGYYANANAYHKIPFIIYILSTASIVLCAFSFPKIDLTIKNPRHKFYISMLVLVLLFVSIRFILAIPQIVNTLLLLGWLAMSLIMLFKLKKNYKAQLSEIYIFYVLLTIALIFWSMYFLAPMALIIFIKYQVNLKFFSYMVAPQWIQTINSLIIITGSVLFGLQKKSKLTSSAKIFRIFSLGLVLMGFGFLVLALGTYLTAYPNKVDLIWIVVSYILQSIGELCIGPIGFALIGRLIPEAYQSIMMGIWVTLLGVAMILASSVSIFAPFSFLQSPVVLMRYENFFLYIGFFALFTAFTLYTINNRLLKSTPVP